MNEEVFEIFEILINNRKPIDESLVASAISACINNKNIPKQIIERVYKLVYDYYKYNNNLSHIFWQIAIEGFLKSNYSEYANDLIKLYPIKYYYSESLWNRIDNIINNNMLTSFNIFFKKYKYSWQNFEEYKGYENIFNEFIESIANY